MATTQVNFEVTKNLEEKLQQILRLYKAEPALLDDPKQKKKKETYEKLLKLAYSAGKMLGVKALKERSQEQLGTSNSQSSDTKVELQELYDEIGGALNQHYAKLKKAKVLERLEKGESITLDEINIWNAFKNDLSNVERKFAQLSPQDQQIFIDRNGGYLINKYRLYIDKIERLGNKVSKEQQDSNKGVKFEQEAKLIIKDFKDLKKTIRRNLEDLESDEQDVKMVMEMIERVAKFEQTYDSLSETEQQGLTKFRDPIKSIVAKELPKMLRRIKKHLKIVDEAKANAPKTADEARQQMADMEKELEALRRSLAA